MWHGAPRGSPALAALAAASTALLFVVPAGCALDRSGLGKPLDSDFDAGPRVDSGPSRPDATMPVDSGPRDSGIPDSPADTYVPPPVDASGCTAGATWCEGERLITCGAGGATSSADCFAASAYCGTDPASLTAACRPWICTPSTTRCADDGTAVMTCDSRGSSESAMPCAYGCDPSTVTCRPMPPPPPPACGLAFEDLAPGTVTFNNCSDGNDQTHVAMTNCSYAGDGRERMFRITLTSEALVALHLVDSDGSYLIDTLLYVRSRCDDASSQIACDDDVPCSEATLSCGGGERVQIRESRIEIRLPAGEYFVIAESLEYSSARCGTMRLRYEMR